MPFIGRYTRYPVYSQFGSNDPSKYNNIMGIIFEKDVFNPGDILNYQMKIGDSAIRLYNMEVEFIESEVDFTILEGVTCVDGVTQVFPDSADRNNIFVSSVYASSDPTGIVGGSPVSAFEHFGLPSPIIGTGDVPPQSVDYVTLKFNTNYIFKFQNVGTVPITDMRFIVLYGE